MRRGFEDAMRQYGEFAKDDKDAREDRKDAPDTAAFFAAEKELERLQEVIGYFAEKRAKTMDTDLDTQREVYALQKRKQEIMDRLHDELAALDDGSPIEARELGKTRTVRKVTARDGKLLWTKEDGAEVQVTLGALITDGEWGIDYDADSAVPRVQRKRLLVERAKREIHDLLDGQIIAEETGSGRVHPSLQRAYESIRERQESETLPHGVIAEKMTSQLVRKRIIDDGAPFRYDPGNVYQDVVRKIDCVIRRADYGRGVHVETAELGAKAVQLTVNRDEQALERKRTQIAKTREKLSSDDHIDDIALVQFDQQAIATAFMAWEEAGRPPGGPDVFLPPKVCDRMFEELTADMGE